MNRSILEINFYCVAFEIFLFNIIGVFGNVQLLWMTVRKKAIRTKQGILLGINALMHLICLLFELPNAGFLMAGIILTRRQCLWILTPYLFTINMQVVLSLGIAIDLFFALFFPLWYRRCRTTLFVVVFVIIGSIFSLFIIVWAWITRDDERIPFCNPPLVLVPELRQVWAISNVSINCLILAVYAAIIAYLKFRGFKAYSTHEGREKHRAIRRLKVIVMVFIGSWFMAVLGVNLGKLIGLSPNVLEIWDSNMVLPALLCYSQAFYVCVWRSSEYRSAFEEQLTMMFCRKRKTLRLPFTATSVGTITR
ncbi:hypothetical protein Q1695_005734 [Nippostrongylus brasiliensis]|nr:hypothetical protein Q1695_005734 [Nippostrongylus brasiliensis]